MRGTRLMLPLGLAASFGNMFLRSVGGVYTSNLLHEVPWVEHGFGTRNSEGWPGHYTCVTQVHSAAVVAADGKSGYVGEGDALVTSTPGQWIGIRTADCVPLLMIDTRNRAVAAVHAGWRGSAANIASATIDRMRELYGTHPDDLLAAIGPCIHECCFEVGPEVSEQFRNYIANPGDHIDLVAVNRAQLLEAGVPADKIAASDLCTFCIESHFHSWRRDREASGRMVAAIGIFDPE